MSLTRGAYDASFSKLVSLVAYRDPRRSENQRILCDKFHWSAKFCFSIIGNLLGAFGDGLDCSEAFRERQGSFRKGYWSVSVFVQIYILLRVFVGWFGSRKNTPRIHVIGCKLAHPVTSIHGVVFVQTCILVLV